MSCIVVRSPCEHKMPPRSNAINTKNASIQNLQRVQRYTGLKEKGGQLSASDIWREKPDGREKKIQGHRLKTMKKHVNDRVQISHDPDPARDRAGRIGKGEKNSETKKLPLLIVDDINGLLNDKPARRQARCRPKDAGRYVNGICQDEKNVSIDHAPPPQK